MSGRPILHFVGRDRERILDHQETRGHIDQLKALRCDLLADSGEPITWADIDNVEEPRTLLQFILSDRKLRVANGAAVTNQPPFGVATVVDGACVRFEFYEGRETLKKTYDLRSRELSRVELADFMETVDRPA